MVKARAIARRMAITSVETARMAIVAGSAFALIFAGRAIPF